MTWIKSALIPTYTFLLIFKSLLINLIFNLLKIHGSYYCYKYIKAIHS